MKKTTLITASAALVFGLNGCGGGANMDPNVSASGNAMANMTDMQNMQRDCKNYLESKFPELPRAAFSVGPGRSVGAYKYELPVRIVWDEPRVDDGGTCFIDNGLVRSFR